MEHRHEVVNFPDNSPVKIFIHKLGDVNMHWLNRAVVHSQGRG